MVDAEPGDQATHPMPPTGLGWSPLRSEKSFHGTSRDRCQNVTHDSSGRLSLLPPTKLHLVRRQVRASPTTVEMLSAESISFFSPGWCPIGTTREVSDAKPQ